MAKFLKFFDNNEQRSTYELSEDYITPYVSAIKGTNGGGVEPHYNIPDNVLCMLILKDKSNVYITDEKTFNYIGMQPYKEDVVSAIFTNRCTSIGDATFLECQSLSSVTLSNNITKLKIATFRQCISLEHITLLNTLKELDSYVFYGSGLKELIIPEGVTKIQGGVISSCPNLESVTFHSSIEDLSGSQFLTDCNKLREIKIIGTKDMTNIITFNRYNIGLKSDLTLYVDSSLVDVYKAQRDRFDGLYKILPLEQ